MASWPLQTGSSGDEVGELQGRLAFLGDYPGPFDGVFERALEQAVEAYHLRRGESGGAVGYAEFERLQHETDQDGYDHNLATSGGYAGNYRRRERDKEEGFAAVTGHELPARGHGQALPDEVVPGEKGSFYTEMEHSLNLMSTRLLALAGLTGAAVQRAVTAFRHEYAEPRIKAVDSEPSGEDYFKFMARHFVDEAGVAITKALPEALGPFKAIWIAFSMAASRSIATTVHNALSEEGGLRAALESLAVDLPTHLAVEETNYRRAIDDALQPIFERLQHHEQLDPVDESWCGPFYRADPAGMDSLIEKVFGIPTSATEVEISVFGRLVESFEEAVLAQLDPAESTSGPESAYDYVENTARRNQSEAEHRVQARMAMEAAIAKRREAIAGPAKSSIFKRGPR